MSLILGLYCRRWAQLTYMYGLVVNAEELDRRAPSSILRRAKHTPIDIFDIVNPLLMTNDGKGRSPS